MIRNHSDDTHKKRQRGYFCPIGYFKEAEECAADAFGSIHIGCRSLSLRREFFVQTKQKSHKAIVFIGAAHYSAMHSAIHAADD